MALQARISACAARSRAAPALRAGAGRRGLRGSTAQTRRVRVCGFSANAVTDLGTCVAPKAEEFADAEAQRQADAALVKALQGRGLPSLPDEEVRRWFLRDRKYDVKEASEKLSAMLQWRDELARSGVSATRIQSEQNIGKAGVYGSRDKLGRPVIIVRPRLHFTNNRDLEAGQVFCAMVLDDAVEMLEPPTEQILGIFDLRGFSGKNADFDFVRFLIKLFFSYHPKRLGRVLFVDAPLAFRPAWVIVKPLLGKYAQLVKFVSASEVTQYFDEGCAPEELSVDVKR